MMNTKKGALELSINTIVIVVIGVTLLTLGLIFVRGIFSQLEDLSSGVFERGEAEVAKISQGEARLGMPSEVSIQQGDAKTFDIVVGNDGLGRNVRFNLRLTPKYPPGISPGQVRAEILTSTAAPGGQTDTITLDNGQVGTFPIKLAAVKDAPITVGLEKPAYTVTVTANGQPYERGAFVISIEKGTGIFG